MYDRTKDPNHWRDRAERTRAKARSARVAEGEKRKLLRVAAEYDRIAEHAARRLGLEDMVTQEDMVTGNAGLRDGAKAEIPGKVN